MKQGQTDHEDNAAQAGLVSWVRARDDEQPVELWNEVTGEMAPRRVERASSARAEADAIVAAALQRVAKPHGSDARDAQTDALVRAQPRAGDA